MDKLPSSGKRVDCRMMRRSLCFRIDRGRIWVFTRHGLAYFKDGRFVAVNAVPGGEVHFITGDKAGNLWLSENQSLLHLLDGRLVEQIPWSELGRRQQS